MGHRIFDAREPFEPRDIYLRQCAETGRRRSDDGVDEPYPCGGDSDGTYDLPCTTVAFRPDTGVRCRT